MRDRSVQRAADIGYIGGAVRVIDKQGPFGDVDVVFKIQIGEDDIAVGNRPVLGAGDGDGQRRRVGGAELVAHRVGEHLGGGGALRQLVGVGIAVVERVAPAA